MSREIYFKIKSSREMASNSDEGIASDTVESLTDVQFRQNFNFMRISGEMCDVTITVEDMSFKAHKLILAGCSPYFRCMFGKKKFSEENMDNISIDPERQLGIKGSAVEQLIEYMYTGYMDFELGNIIDLIWASDLFQLPEIKEQGLDKLEQHIDFLVSNFRIIHFKYVNSLDIFFFIGPSFYFFLPDLHGHFRSRYGFCSSKTHKGCGPIHQSQF